MLNALGWFTPLTASPPAASAPPMSLAPWERRQPFDPLDGHEVCRLLSHFAQLLDHGRTLDVCLARRALACIAMAPDLPLRVDSTTWPDIARAQEVIANGTFLALASDARDWQGVAHDPCVAGFSRVGERLRAITAPREGSTAQVDVASGMTIESSTPSLALTNIQARARTQAMAALQAAGHGTAPDELTRGLLVDLALWASTQRCDDQGRWSFEVREAALLMPELARAARQVTPEERAALDALRSRIDWSAWATEHAPRALRWSLAHGVHAGKAAEGDELPLVRSFGVHAQARVSEFYRALHGDAAARD